ncbi:MAG: ATP-binding protein [Croceitalea sp.]|nr:ATP-binding protein [Croceitalea sp.]
MNSNITTASEAVHAFDVGAIGALINTYGDSLEVTTSAKELQNLILVDFLDFSNAYIALGSSEFRKHHEIEGNDHMGVYLMHHALSEPFKDLLFLHRDVLLQLTIAHHKQLEKLVDEDAIAQHFEKSKATLMKALGHFGQKTLSEAKEAQRLQNSKNGIASKLKHIQNPWSIYEEQFSKIQEQIVNINVSGKSFEQVIAVFNAIRSHTHEVGKTVLKEADTMMLYLEEGIKTIENLTEVSQIDQTLDWLESTVSKIDLDHLLQENFNAYLESKTVTLPKVDHPIETAQGIILTKKMDMGRAAQKWLDYTPLPYFMDLWENRLQAISFFKHRLLNLENALMLDKANKSLETLSVQLDGFKSVRKSLKEYQEKQTKVVDNIQEVMQTEFLATNMYHSDEFLEVSLQSSMFQLSSQRKGLLDRFGETLKNFVNKLGTQYEQKVADNPSQRLEQAMQCIDYRMFKEENANYDTLFLNKNFIGDLFLVDRPEDEKKTAEAIRIWKSGIHKSILVLGNPLSGKSTFMEKMAKEHFGKQYIWVSPNSEIVVEGRKFKTTKDLEEALKNVKKSLYNTRPAILIDNLELWRSKDHPLLENVQALLDFLDMESDHVFVMVSVSEMMKKHLDHRLSFSNRFSNEINIGQAEFSTIYKAILLRNGASHRILVDEVENPLTDKQIEQSIRKLCRSLDYNLGEVLQAWTYGTTMIADSKVIYEDRQITFADFFTTTELLILKYVALYTYINELILKEFMGNRFNQNYKSSLYRLTNTKVLLRDEIGDLRINTVLAHDIRRLLKYHGMLK